MSQLLSRIMLAIFMLPCASVLYVLGVVILEKNHVFSYPLRRYAVWIVAGMAAWSFIALYWALLWRATVRWTVLRLKWTVMATAASLAVGVVAGVLMTAVEDDIGAWFGSVVAPLAWLILTTLIWRESTEERASRASGQSTLTCPTCGYNLTGLQSTRCPECGTQFTLDTLISMQKDPSEPELK